MMALADVLTRLAVVYLRGRRAHRRQHPGKAPPAAAPYSCTHSPLRLGRTEAEAMARQRPGSPRGQYDHHRKRAGQ